MNEFTTAHQPEPLIDGALRDQVIDVVRGISTLPAQRRSQLLANPSLARGHAGIAILYGYQHLSIDDDEAATFAQEQIETAADTLADAAIEPALYGGLSGFAWSIAHLTNLELFETIEEDYDDIDSALLELVAQPACDVHYELVSGLVGIGVYALERLPATTPRAILEHIARHLDATSEKQDGGITWKTDPHFVPPQQREYYPAGYYNLGVAHGVPGVIALLGRMCAANVAVDLTHPMLDGAVTWLLRQRLESTAPSCYGSIITPDVGISPSRTAWCYGDPGIAATLLVAANAVGRDDWRSEALEVAHHAAQVPFEQSGVVDAGLCHGSAGLAHIFHRLYRSTGDALLREAAITWIKRTLEFHRPGTGIGGFSAIVPAAEGKTAELDSPGFLEGSAGIALALLATVTEIDPEWDRVLLLSGNPQRETTGG